MDWTIGISVSPYSKCVPLISYFTGHSILSNYTCCNYYAHQVSIGDFDRTWGSKKTRKFKKWQRCRETQISGNYFWSRDFNNILPYLVEVWSFQAKFDQEIFRPGLGKWSQNTILSTIFVSNEIDQLVTIIKCYQGHRKSGNKTHDVLRKTTQGDIFQMQQDISWKVLSNMSESLDWPVSGSNDVVEAFRDLEWLENTLLRMLKWNFEYFFAMQM